MLRFLLDENISPVVARQILVPRPEIAVVSLAAWERGTYLASPDDVLLLAACRQGLTLVTYDQRTIVPLIKLWSEQGITHGGVIFVSRNTIRHNDFGSLVQALCQLWDRDGATDWTDRVAYLTR